MLESQPADAQLWIYTASRPFEESESTEIIKALEPFLASWQSHGRQVRGEATIIDNRFLIIGAHIPGGAISGCGIDASTDAVESASATTSISWLNNLYIVYRDKEGVVKAVQRPEFRSLLESGEIDASTCVFDLSISTVGDLRSGLFEQPFHKSWHADHFGIPQI